MFSGLSILPYFLNGLEVSTFCYYSMGLLEKYTFKFLLLELNWSFSVKDSDNY